MAQTKRVGSSLIKTGTVLLQRSTVYLPLWQLKLDLSTFILEYIQKVQIWHKTWYFIIE